jgi:hypothetical protein
MPARIRSYNAVVLFGVAVVMILVSGLVVGLLDGGHPHVASSPSPTTSPTPPTLARRLLSVADDPRNAFDHEMRKRGYSHLSVRSNPQFSGVARDMFPFASKPMVLDVYASTQGQAHWLVVSSADYNTKADWKSSIVTKSNNSYVVSAQHKTLHKDIVESIQTSLE